ncbi:MAG: inositol monophosphatase family protein [Rhizobiaceae bacterium]
MARSALLQIMTTTAFRAGRSLSRDFGEVQNLQVSIKGPGEFIEKSAKNATKIIREQLSKARPDFGMMIKGTVEQIGSDKQNRWIVDPLNGQTNFAHALPYFGISIALEREGQIVAGVIYNPALDDLYAAERGSGAFQNDRRLRVANRRHLSDCLIGADNTSSDKSAKTDYLKIHAQLLGQVESVRNFGCTCLSLTDIARGSLDGHFESGTSYESVAAGAIVVREAGGYISTASDNKNLIDQDTVLATNSGLHEKLLEILN